MHERPLTPKTVVSSGHLVQPTGCRHHVTVEWAQAATIVSALAAFTGLQAVWMSHALDRVYARFDGIDARLDRIDARLDRIEGVVLRDHAERMPASKPHGSD